MITKDELRNLKVGDRIKLDSRGDVCQAEVICADGLDVLVVIYSGTLPLGYWRIDSATLISLKAHEKFSNSNAWWLTESIDTILEILFIVEHQNNKCTRQSYPISDLGRFLSGVDKYKDAPRDPNNPREWL